MWLVQRFAAGSLFKRTIFQHIAEDMLNEHTSAKQILSCPIDERAHPLVTTTTESLLQGLLHNLEFDDTDSPIDRHKVSDGLQRLGKCAAYAHHCIDCGS